MGCSVLLVPSVILCASVELIKEDAQRSCSVKLFKCYPFLEMSLSFCFLRTRFPQISAFTIFAGDVPERAFALGFRSTLSIFFCSAGLLCATVIRGKI